MMPSSKKRLTPKPGELSEQSKAFIETARDIGCDENESAFKERLGKLLNASAAPKDENVEAARGRASRQRRKPRS